MGIAFEVLACLDVGVDLRLKLSSLILFCIGPTVSAVTSVFDSTLQTILNLFW